MGLKWAHFNPHEMGKMLFSSVFACKYYYSRKALDLRCLLSGCLLLNPISYLLGLLCMSCMYKYLKTETWFSHSTKYPAIYTKLKSVFVHHRNGGTNILVLLSRIRWVQHVSPAKFYTLYGVCARPVPCSTCVTWRLLFRDVLPQPSNKRWCNRRMKIFGLHWITH